MKSKLSMDSLLALCCVLHRIQVESSWASSFVLGVGIKLNHAPYYITDKEEEERITPNFVKICPKFFLKLIKCTR